MIQTLRSSRHSTEVQKSVSDMKIDEILQQVMTHAEQWMNQVTGFCVQGGAPNIFIENSTSCLYKIILHSDFSNISSSCSNALNPEMPLLFFWCFLHSFLQAFFKRKTTVSACVFYILRFGQVRRNPAILQVIDI